MYFWETVQYVKSARPRIESLVMPNCKASQQMRSENGQRTKGETGKSGSPSFFASSLFLKALCWLLPL